jgi:hypothetical protein
VRTDLLERDRSSPLRVFVVWAPNVPGDARAAVDSRVLGDRRVTAFWDEHGRAHRWFAERLGPEAVSWDAYFLFDAGARWHSQPDAPTSSGSPVFDDRDELRTALAKTATLGRSSRALGAGPAGRDR